VEYSVDVCEVPLISHLIEFRTFLADFV
jgi:hypothetical protein